MTRIAAALAFLTLALPPALARADTVVTRCTGDRDGGSGGSNLADAIQAGGDVTFNCGDNATIQMSAPHTITKPVVIDGGLKVTLKDGGKAMFSLDPVDGALELKNLKFQGTQSTVVEVFFAKLQGPQSPPVNINSDTANAPLKITGSTFDGCAAPISMAFGALTIRDSVFKNGSGTNITTTGPLLIERSRFTGTMASRSRASGPT